MNTGHAVLFSPNGLCVKSSDENCQPRVSPLGQGYLTVRSRLRVTRDGGHSLLAVQDAQRTMRLGRVYTAASAATSYTHPPPNADHAQDNAGTQPLPPQASSTGVSSTSHGSAILDNSSLHGDGKAPTVPLTGCSSNVTPSSLDPPPASAGSILKLISQAHSNGYPLVALSYLRAQLAGGQRRPVFESQAQLQIALDTAVLAGHLLVKTDVWRYSLPLDSPYRRPVHPHVEYRSDSDESEFAPLLRYLRTHSPILRRSLREHFQNNEPDAPYGHKVNKVQSIIDRACKTGIVKLSGKGKEALISWK
jgi:hypothetical protein